MSKDSFQSDEALEEAKFGLERVQNFDPDDLVQASKLGENSFRAAVEPAQKLIDLFKQLPMETLNYFPNKELQSLKKQTDSVFNRFTQILEFTVNEGDVSNRQAQLVSGLWQQLQPTFTALLPMVSFTAAKTVDIPALEQSARAAVQSIRDQTEALRGEIEEQKEEADNILEDVRKTAAERGVSQEAYHFQAEAETHNEISTELEKSVWSWAVAIGVYAVATIFFHKIPFLSPENNFETVQLVVSKVLIFAVLAAMLALRIRALLSHKHNEIVNRHRQNALMTYRSLVSAGGASETRDIVLQQAASAIYQPQDTGYVKGRETSNTSVTEFIPRTSMPISGGGT